MLERPRSGRRARPSHVALGVLAAVEAAVTPYLVRPPCIVPFSGGRDSSLVLACAARVAARESLPPPIPLTLRFPYASTKEDSWQDLVVSYLGLDDWLRVDLTDELDYVGAVAASGLDRHGVLYPPNIHIVTLCARYAEGGSVLTGDGGDSVFGAWPWSEVANILAGRARPRPNHLRTFAHAAAPAWLRAEVLRRRQPLLLPWLREPWRREAAMLVARNHVTEPRTWSARVRAVGEMRAYRASQASAEILGRDCGVRVVAPLLDQAVLDSIARAGGLTGWGDRTATMRSLFAHVLPSALLERRGKATFGPTFHGRESRAFAERWDGRSGIDPDLVDAEVLRQAWLADEPPFASAMLLQSAWLASEGAPAGTISCLGADHA